MLIDGVDVLTVGRSFCKGADATENVTRIYARMIAEERYAAAGELRELTRPGKHGGFTDAFYEGKPGPDMQGRPESSEYGSRFLKRHPRWRNCRRRSPEGERLTFTLWRAVMKK